MDPAVLKHIRGELLSPEEEEIVRDWRSQSPEKDQLLKDFETSATWVTQGLRKTAQLDTSDIWQKVKARLEAEGFGPFPADAPATPLPRPSRSLVLKVSIAACTLFLIGLGIKGIINYSHPAQKAIVTVRRTVARTGSPGHAGSAGRTDSAGRAGSAAKIPPGSNKAVLTLANGRQIYLHSVGNGLLARQDNIKVSKVADGRLRYVRLPSSVSSYPTLFNTISTPRAGQFSLVLPDNSRVWLNNVSTLRFPVNFTGNTREVELRGEAYFEVARDKAHPFIVHILKGAGSNTDTATVKVLGTRFNIKAYEGEDSIYATLTKGRIRFYDRRKTSLLSAGDQLVLSKDTVEIRHKADTASTIAWKNGLFNFNHSSLESTMWQIARWYDVKVDIRGKPHGYEFGGGISRSNTLDEIFKGLEKYGVHCRLEGRTIIVTVE
ncbi:hypothetical protein GCM10011511_54300 [Puia dinghuensis]|uniref:FecR family protein n=2 Tax=Puia dinghuensis TaxID=1792502 RepID=A0A8J2UIZ4_9BACT|nr:hypothetical protein GCM10011511_54300 [Puia dinghuensis]